MENCKYGFYTCQFKGQVCFCNECDGGNNYQMKEETRGGQREGAGRPFAPPTKVITFRIRIPWEKRIRKIVKDEVEKLKKI